MSNIRALVSCTILSLQDSCFVYPSCKCCLSRLTQENTRATCSRCGFTCDPQNVDYRYRLSVKVSRNQDIFGVTVFGGCLNPFFGITAGGLQRCVELEKSNCPHTVQQLLVKAVEDCFIGRCIVLGLKVSHDDVTTWLADQQSSSLVLKSRQLIACQIISPSEAFGGFTVYGYLKNLLQSNSHSSDFESASNGTSLSQQKDSQRDELTSFDYTLPSCARLNSQPSSEEFTLSNVWQSPGLCCTPGDISNDSLQQSGDFDFESLFPKNEKVKTEPSLDRFKHINGLQDKLKNDAQSSSRKSLSENDSEVMISSHSVLKAIFGEQYDAHFDNSCLSHFGQNACLDLEDAPLSENVLDFVRVEPQLSEITDAKQLRFSDKQSSGKQDEIIEEQSSCSLNDHSKLKRNISKTASAIQRRETSKFPIMCNVNNKSLTKNNENDCPENLEITLNNAVTPKTPNVLCTTRFSGVKKKKMILADLNMNFSADTKDNRLCFSNRKDFTLQTKRLTSSGLSVAFCSLNHEEGKYFRHCVESEIHSVKCKVQQEQIVCDDNTDTFNCSADLFVSCQNSVDMNQSDVPEISKVNEAKNVNTSEPGVSGALPFSPCLQSTPVSYQHAIRQKTGGSNVHVESLYYKRLKLEFKSDMPGLKENRQNKPKVTMSELDRLQIVAVTERFLDKSDVQGQSSHSSVNVNEWSKDLFENSF